MITVIAREVGQGKTKELLSKANECLENSKGTVVYIDDNPEHSLVLDKKIRYININDYPVDSLDAFFGFIYGMLSSNYDIEVICIDNILKIVNCETEQAVKIISMLENITKKHEVRFMLTAKRSHDSLETEISKYVI